MWFASCAWLLGVALLLPAPVAAHFRQSLSEPEAVASFLLAFARFVQWPEDAMPPGSPLAICAADGEVFRALERLVIGRTAHDRRVVARATRADADHGDCAILYVRGVDHTRTNRLLDALGPATVLTVSDQRGFARWGGGIELFREDGRMVFLINRRAAERPGLRLSSRLLGLARLLDD